MSTVRIRCPGGGMISLKLVDGVLLGAQVESTRIYYICDATLVDRTAAALTSIVDDSLPGEAVHRVKMAWTPTVGDGAFEYDGEVCHFDNPYLPDWLLGTRHADGSLKDANCA